MFDKGIMFLGGAFGQGLEPMGVVCHTILLGPLSHARGHGIGDGAVEGCSIVDNVNHLLVHVTLQILIHFRACEDFLSEILRRALLGGCYLQRLLRKCFLYYLES